MARLELYATKQERAKVIEVAEKTGKPISWLMLHALDYWLSNNPRELNDLAGEFHSLRAERDAKEMERDTGDLLGSFEKMEEKIKRIEEAKRKGNIDKKFADMLIEETKRNYETTQTAKEERLKKRVKKQEMKKGKSRAERLAEMKERVRKLKEKKRKLKKEIDHALSLTSSVWNQHGKEHAKEYLFEEDMFTGLSEEQKRNVWKEVFKRRARARRRQ